MSEAIVTDLAAVATHPSNTPLILQRLPLDRARLRCWPASCEARLDKLQRVGKPAMSKHLIALILGALAIASISPAAAQAPQGTAAGVLSCKLAPSIGLIFGSQQRMACRFAPNGPYPPEAYLGVMNSIGLDIGITAGGAMAWGVVTPNAGPMRGKLAGKYVGASGSVGLGVGVGANVLVGGSNRSISLQPLSVEGTVGINLSLGVSGLTLTLAQ
jgi:hypothetical protein